MAKWASALKGALPYFGKREPADSERDAEDQRSGRHSGLSFEHEGASDAVLEGARALAPVVWMLG